MYNITPMKTDDIPSALSVWRSQLDKYYKNDSFPDFYKGGRETVEKYLSQQIEKENAIIAKKNGDTIGYMAWLCFDFHGERTAHLPIIGNAALPENETAILRELYSNASKRWVKDDRFDHLWMTFYDDADLNNMLFEMGFGSYLTNASQKTYPFAAASPPLYKIAEATERDADAVLEIANASEKDLLEPPVFLKRDLWKKEDIIKLMEKVHIFAAWDGEIIAGLISFETDLSYHHERLTTPDSASIGGIGAYVRPEYRRKGVGALILKHIFDYCHSSGKSFLHVDFESSNPNAIGFWPKYFKPSARAVRRSVNKDANCKL